MFSLAELKSAISVGIAALIAAALIIVVGFGVYLTNTPNQSASILQQDVYKSDINSSSPCTYTAINNSTDASSTTGADASSIIANIENYPQFKSLEGNRTYTFQGFGCNGQRDQTNGTMIYQSEITFSYYDQAHPIYYKCGNQNASTLPQYQIIVTLALTPTGYDLTNSSFSSILVQPFEGCSAQNG